MTKMHLRTSCIQPTYYQKPDDLQQIPQVQLSKHHGRAEKANLV